MKILIVDDSVSMRQMISIILTGAGHEVTEAVDGSDGLHKLNEEIDAVVTDYNMPNMGGIEFIRNVRGGTVNKKVPILMLTTESEASKKTEGREAGATAWITKPFNRESLLTTLDKITRSVSF
ncbi:MAG: response regulator [Alkalispirochaeta sp.]|jgi:two-component system chemotaxis response regulator CheY